MKKNAMNIYQISEIKVRSVISVISVGNQRHII